MKYGTRRPCYILDALGLAVFKAVLGALVVFDVNLEVIQCLFFFFKWLVKERNGMEVIST